MEETELKDFIAQAVSQIMEGVKEAHGLAKKVGGAVNPKGQIYLTADSAKFQDKHTSRIGDFIHFDVEVEITEGKEKTGSGKLSVFSAATLGGKISGKKENRSLNRLSFRLPVIYPKGKYEENEKITYNPDAFEKSLDFSVADSSASSIITASVHPNCKTSGTPDEGI